MPHARCWQANGKVNQQGAVADYLEVETGLERAVEAFLGEVLQHIDRRAAGPCGGRFSGCSRGVGRALGIVVIESVEAPGSDGRIAGSAGGHRVAVVGAPRQQPLRAGASPVDWRSVAYRFLRARGTSPPRRLAR